MDALTLIFCARALGLSVVTDGDRLVVRGPKRAAAVAAALLDRKPEVLAALAEADRGGRPLDWPEPARRRFTDRVIAADGTVAAPGSEEWDCGVREARRVAAGFPPASSRPGPTIVDRALEAFASVGGLTLQRITSREVANFPTGTVAPLGDRCPMCRRSLWWATRPDPTLWTCGACHPPVAALGRVFWRGSETGESGRVV